MEARENVKVMPFKNGKEGLPGQLAVAVLETARRLDGSASLVECASYVQGHSPAHGSQPSKPGNWLWYMYTIQSSRRCLTALGPDPD